MKTPETNDTIYLIIFSALAGMLLVTVIFLAFKLRQSTIKKKKQRQNSISLKQK